MHYSVQGGSRNTVFDKLHTVTNQVSARNLLPAIVGGLTALWIGLLLIAIQQTSSLNPGNPSNLTATRNDPPMSVVSSTSDTALQGPSTGTTAQASAQYVQTTDSAASMDNAAAPTQEDGTISSALEPIIGGRGADETTTPGATPEIPTIPAVESSVDVEIDTPVTPDPISVEVGTDDGVQLGADVGGLIDLDLGLGL